MPSFYPLLAPRRNSALKNNPPLGTEAHITTKASDWLWCVFAIFLFVDICLYIWCVFRRPGTRLLNQLALFVLTISMVAYFSEASDLGWTAVPTAFNHYTPRGTLRQTWWVRYVDWILTLPLLLIMVSFASGSHWRQIMSLAFAGAVVWTGWLLGAVVASQYKWAYYVFAIVIGVFYIFYALLWTVKSDAERLGGEYQFVQLSSSAFMCFMLIMYAVAWGCCEGANTVSNSSEMVWYGILDCFSKPFFLIYFLWMTRDYDYTLLREVRYTHTHEQYQAEADAATRAATGENLAQTGAGMRSRFAPIVGRRRGPQTSTHGVDDARHEEIAPDAEADTPDRAAAAAAAAAATERAAIASGDPEKAAAAKSFRNLFSRRGAHDDRSVPAVRPPSDAGGEQPARVSNATMVESEPTHDAMHGDYFHGTHPRNRPAAVRPPVHISAPAAAADPSATTPVSSASTVAPTSTTARAGEAAATAHPFISRRNQRYPTAH